MDVAGTLRSARRAAGLTQRALAARAGVHRVTLARWEAGAATPSAHRFALVLAACRASSGAAGRDELDADDVALLEAQLARRPEDRLRASIQLARLRAAASR